MFIAIFGKSLLKYNCSCPLSAAGEERAVERSNDLVSRPGGHYRQCISANVRRVDSPRVLRLKADARPSLPLRGKEGKAPIYNLATKTILKAISLIAIFRI